MLTDWPNGDMFRMLQRGAIPGVWGRKYPSRFRGGASVGSLRTKSLRGSKLTMFCELLLARLMGQYCFLTGVCRLSASSDIVCNAAGGRAGRPPGAWAVGRPTLHGGPVRLRPVMATPCCYYYGFGNRFTAFTICTVTCGFTVTITWGLWKVVHIMKSAKRNCICLDHPRAWSDQSNFVWEVVIFGS